MRKKTMFTDKRMKADGRALRYVDAEVILLFKRILSMYGTSGTRIILQAIVDGKLKPKI